MAAVAGDPGLTVLVPAWGTAYAASWAAAVAQAIRSYQALPTTQPTGCYVASAAARGIGGSCGRATSAG